MTKNAFFASVIALIGMLAIGFYSAYIAKKITEKKLFEIHTKDEFSKLSDLKNNKYDLLIFMYSSSLFGSVLAINKENFHPDEMVCIYLNDEMRQFILDSIEKRTPIPEIEKKKYNQKFHHLIEMCKRKE